MKNKKKILALSMALLLTACGNTNKNDTVNNKNEQTEVESKVDDKKEESVATVNGKDISLEDYYKNLSFISYYTSAQQNMKYPIIDMLVEKQIIEEDVEKNNIKPTQEDIDKAYKENVDAFGGTEKFEKMLEDYNIDKDFVKKQAEQKAMYETHQSWYIKNHEVSEEDINKYYEEHKDQLEEVSAKHILLNDEKTAKEVKQKLDDGQNWDDLAKEYSQDSYNKEKGGDLGYFKRNDMDQRFSEKAFSMNKGDISEPIESSFGWHIIKVEDVKNNVSSVKEDIKKEINQEKYYNYIKELRDKAEIDIKDKDVKDALENVDTQQSEDDNTKDEGKENNIQQ
jgi:foldase protein prsA